MDSAETGSAGSALGDEMDDWLWDLEDRYDLGAVDDPEATQLSPLVQDPRLAGVRRYRRSKNGTSADVEADGEDNTGETAELAGALPEPTHLVPPPARRPRRRDVNKKALATAALVLIGLGGLFVATRHHGSNGSGQPNVAIGSNTTVRTVVVGPPGVASTQPTTGDTVPVAGVPGSSVPGAAAAVATPAGSTPGDGGALFTPVGSVFTPSGNTGTGRPTPPPANPPAPPGTTSPPPATTSPPPATTTPPPATTSPPNTPPATRPPDTTVPRATTVPTTAPGSTTVPHPFP